MGNLSTLEFLFTEEAGLTGEIPQEIGNLRNLVILVIELNKLRGHIPATIFNISTMQVISFVNNHLSGNLPSNIGHGLPNLEDLLLGNNTLSGVIPSYISNASKLVRLELVFNRFTGPIPNSLGSLRLLELLNLAYNNLTAESSSSELSFFTSLTNCQHLEILEVSYNPLNCILPASMGNFSFALQVFGASGCKIKGNIPDDIVEGLLKLQELYLRDNRLGGSIPNDICSLKYLNVLVLSINKLSASIPECLGNITSLRYLHLSSNKLNSGIPESLWNLKDLLEFGVASNSLTGYVSPGIGSLKVATVINLSMNQLSGDIPSTIGGLQNLKELSLEHNRLQGSIPESFSKLVSLESLDLSQNNLSGAIPKSLEALLYLTYFNVSFNRLRGEIPTGGPFTNFTRESFMSNEAFCGAPHLQFPFCDSNFIHRSKKKRVLLIVFILLGIASVVIALIVALVLIRGRRRNHMQSQSDLLPKIMNERISYYELQRATDGFSESNLLGIGSFGSVYKGVLADGMLLAAKVFNLQIEGAFKSFDTECEVLRNLRHRNLTKVISSCSNLDFKSLVLEYMPNGSLEKWLYSHNYYLDIMQRLDIMIDVACALEYLHDAFVTPVAHCDVKPSNVLLDIDMVGHLSDFGIAKLFGVEESLVLTKTLGTIGYIAPEYGSEGLVSTQCDVYSYGIVLMETFSRKKPTDEIFGEDLSLKGWINESLPNSISQVIDANLISPGEPNLVAKLQCVSSIMELALDCCVEYPEERIYIKDVLAALRKIRLQFIANCRRV
ncbi:unnamed protein product [Ilex paraguariensis]|uniref:non-specific serine/threonine protein kinase n=1 Tax=Ilex paraguariensis TaxID=185542 RepID=A0ABC8S4H3_9AQUA